MESNQTEEEQRQDIIFLAESIKNARENGLEYEFLEFFLIDYRKTNDIRSAVWFADCEWDL